MTELEEKYYLASTTDKDGIILSASKAFCEISGYSKEELIGKNHNIVRHPDTKKETFSTMWETINSGKIWKGKIKNLKKDGGFFWADSTIEPVFDENANIIKYKAIRFDITDKIELLNQQALNFKVINDFKLLVDTANIGIAFLNYAGLFVEVNPYIVNLLGYKEKELYKIGCMDLTAEEFLENNITILENIKNSDEAVKSIKQCIKGDGSLVWVEATYKIFDKERILLVLKDIEPYKQLEENNKLMLAQSKQAGMGELLSMVAHQWRQPLTTLITILSKMKIKYSLGNLSKNDFENDFAKAKSTVFHLSKTIDTFYEYFKEKQGNKISITMLLDSVNGIIEPILEVHEISTILECEDDDLLVDDRVDQVILNIFQNAKDVLIKNNIDTAKFIKVTIFVNEAKMLVIRISDNAGGIPEDIQHNIFDPYFSTKSKNGSGLGLYMSKNIVETQIGGKLSAYNTESGACFEILIPQN
nr:PAS domain S-box protein [uncultured Sulfurimonas sp.]